MLYCLNKRCAKFCPKHIVFASSSIPQQFIQVPNFLGRYQILVAYKGFTY